MTGKTITLVVPPGTGGVRDYADIMAHGLRERGHDARVFAWCKDDAGAIDAQIAESDCIYLQYSGYGYARRGAPLWMLDAVKRKRSRIRKFGVFFHELYAFGPPWGSAFWLSPVQRHVAAGLARLSDFWLTNRELSTRWLEKQAANVPNATLPVFSNVGELSVYSRVRRKKTIVFGSAALRRKTYVVAGTRLFQWVKRHGLELHDIGAPLADVELDVGLGGYGVHRHGRLEPEAIGDLLSEAMFGILAYPVEYVAKSGVFAAYCAHGVTPVLLAERHAVCDGLHVGSQYLSASIFDVGELAESQGVDAWRWYSGHDIAAHVARTDEFLGAV